MPRAKSTEPTCLFPDEAEIARLVIGPGRARRWTGLAVVLERSGLPKIDVMMGGRYWPAVQAFFDRRHNVLSPAGRQSASEVGRPGGG